MVKYLNENGNYGKCDQKGLSVKYLIKNTQKINGCDYDYNDYDNDTGMLHLLSQYLICCTCLTRSRREQFISLH